MTKEELKAKLIAVNATLKTPRSDAEIDNIITKFERSAQIREATIATNNSTNPRKVLNKLLADFEPANTRLFVCAGMGIMVKKEGDKAVVTFSFLNPKDVDENYVYDGRLFKIHAIENYKANKYTYTVDWHGRSEFAVYDAFVAHHKEFPGDHKNGSVTIHIGCMCGNEWCGDVLDQRNR